MNNHEWMLKSIETEPKEVSGKVVKPDLVLIEGILEQIVSVVDAEGIVKRCENKVPFSRQVTVFGALPGQSVAVDCRVRNTKPRPGSRVGETTLVSLAITVQDNQGLVGFATDEFLLQEPKLQLRSDPEQKLAPEKTAQPADFSVDLEKLRRELETEYALRYQQECFEFEQRLRDSYQDDLRLHVELLRREMEAELNRRWKQQLSAFQQRSGFRGSVEFGRA
ncbi:MAG: hypothetical protein GX058_02685 [Firmicutes bacterium]|nr:hypothetical protein [Bacillota bacterium]